ncbi:MAG: hypothetical protein FJ034_01960 [Chloroflexi bacterium]|nr:hypothetical protein [Chloroflexota bacterium]
MIDLFRALAAVVEAEGPERERMARLLELPPASDDAARTELFDMHLYPRAAVYLGPEGMLGGEALDRIAGFWRAAGLEPPTEPDHLGALLTAYAALAEREEAAEGARRALATQARSALLWEHLASWLPVYLAAVDRLGAEHDRAWARLLGRALIAEAERSPGAALSAHLVAAPGLADPREEGGAKFLASLLAPARAGFILTRIDLARGAAKMGLGLRQGERRYALESLFGQDGPRTLRWLRDEARAAGKRHERLPGAYGAVRDHWRTRAEASAALLASAALAGSREG